MYAGPVPRLRQLASVFFGLRSSAASSPSVRSADLSCPCDIFPSCPSMPARASISGMSAKNAQTGVELSAAVAVNVRQWRLKRGLDQQGLADRLAELGWNADRTTVNKVEQMK